MNKDKKFRVWDTKYNVMICTGFHLLGEVMAFGQIEEYLFNTQKSDGIPTIDRWNDLEIMQFTGLKDKKGIDIYEGDIVQRGVITFSRGKFQGTYIDSNGRLEEDWEDDLYLEKNIEVLGNIYEHPELLKNDW